MPTPNPLVPPSAVRAVDRLVLRRLRSETCVIARRGPGRGPSGAANTGEYAPIATVACRIVASKRAAAVGTGGGNRFTTTTDYQATFDRTVAIQSQDRVEVNGRTFQVVAVAQASHGFQVTADIKEVS